MLRKKNFEIKIKDIKWFLPTVYLLSTFILLIIFEKSIDRLFGEFFRDIISFVISENEEILVNNLANNGEIVPAIIAIALTVIAIVVELVANKYSPKIVDLFIDDRKNNLIIGFFVIASLNQLYVSNSISTIHNNYFSIFVSILMVMLAVILIIPYFGYVFTFLHPTHFILLIKERAIRSFRDINKTNYMEKKNEFHYYIDFLGDIAINSSEQSDRFTTLECINSLTDILINYQSYKKLLPNHWYLISPIEKNDPDFTDLSPFVMQNIEKNKNWLERKVFKLYELLFSNTHTTQKDIASGILSNLQKFAKVCIENKNLVILDTIMTMLNTLLRISLNAHFPRSAFNILEHYRVIGEYLIVHYPQKIEELAKYIKYYAQESNKLGVYFIMETAAHDLYMLNKVAYEHNIPNINKLLDIFLSLDEQVEEGREKEEQRLIGVRIAQTKLAAFYLFNNRSDLADRIYKDMKTEPLSRIEKIKLLILATTDHEYYEFTGRGINFYFIEEDYKPYLMEFFTWFEFNYD
ncbi:MAG TPA: DUF2254 family protein [Ignavibacteriales bacterium]|nr:DUF2254 family protein [Ignavibacteriales bacterium]HPP33247.1 DUF2254 family protein [Ignavibacteriales bacterium]